MVMIATAAAAGATRVTTMANARPSNTARRGGSYRRRSMGARAASDAAGVGAEDKGAPRGKRGELRKLGDSDLMVSEICLGSMTWGKQNTEREAHQQLNYAICDRGINFIDTAEMYPVPTEAETQGLTDKYIGSWLKKGSMRREDVVLAGTTFHPSPAFYRYSFTSSTFRLLNPSMRKSLIN